MNAHLRFGPTVLCLPLLLLGCNDQPTLLSGNGNPSGHTANHIPDTIRHAEIIPIPLTLEGPVSVRVSTESVRSGEGKFRFRWFVNDRQIAVTNEGRLSPEQLKRNDKVRVEVRSIAAEHEGAPYMTESAVVVNTLPSVKAVTFDPAQPKPGDKIQLKFEAVDPDQDEVRVKIKWWRNERLISEGEDTVLDTTGFARGDRIVASIAVRDEQALGKEFFSQPYQLANGPPRFVESEAPRIVGGRLEHTVRAVDPESDPLSFSLENPPPGMTIDEKTGRIDWLVPAEAKGGYRTKVVVKDDHEGWASQELEIAAPPAPAAT